MNKVFFYALAASSLALGACTNDSNVDENGNEQGNALQQITVQVASSGDGMTTRAGRELESSEATQDINKVQVLVCTTDGTIKYTKTLDNWNGDGSEVYTTGGHGRQATFTIPTENHLSAGTYKVYAIGYSDDSDYDLSAITSAAIGGTFNENTVLKYKEDGGKKAEEIFAGEASYTVEEGVKATGTVILNRQVAGTFGYVEDIPYVDGATKLQLVASTSNSELVLGQFANFELTSNGTNNTQNVKYVVNGNNSANNVVVYTINLNDWFTALKDEKDANGNDGADGLIDIDNWKTEGHDYYKKGSVFAGSFIIPFAKTEGQTFTLQLVKDDNSVVRSWNVNLPEGDGQLAEHSVSTWNGTSFATTTVTDTKSAYSVVRNHLYGIGTRMSAKPAQPGTDPGDKPESLKKAQNITLRVNDNWEVIHNMELE